MANNQIQYQRLTKEQKLEMQQKLRKDIIIAQFLNYDFSSQNYRNLLRIKNEVESKLEAEIFGPS